MRTITLSHLKYQSVRTLRNLLSDGGPIGVTVGRHNPETVAVLMTPSQFEEMAIRSTPEMAILKGGLSDGTDKNSA